MRILLAYFKCPNIDSELLEDKHNDDETMSVY
ncbi:unnamed protein product, partial [Adineta steineri]